MSIRAYTHYAWPDAESSDSRIALGAHGHAEIEPGYLTSQLLQGCEVPMGCPGGAGICRWFGNFVWGAGAGEIND